MTADIQVLTEKDINNGWLFTVRVTDPDGSQSEYETTLSWADYDLWCRGSAPPERVVAALFTFLLQRENKKEILSRFDAALVRRYFRDVDDILPGLIIS